MDDIDTSNVILIFGPSGVGLDSVIEGLQKKYPIRRVITTTTREKRAGESEGNPYYFIKKDEFKSKLEKGDFLEWAKHYNGNYYGVDKKEIENALKDRGLLVWKTEFKGVKTIKSKFPDILSIMIYANPNQIEKRLQKRGDLTKEQIKERMEYTNKWLQSDELKNLYDYKIENKDGKLDDTIGELINILKLENKI